VAYIANNPRPTNGRPENTSKIPIWRIINNVNTNIAILLYFNGNVRQIIAGFKLATLPISALSSSIEKDFEKDGPILFISRICVYLMISTHYQHL
jgi:hypothetical protein